MKGEIRRQNEIFNQIRKRISDCYSPHFLGVFHYHFFLTGEKMKTRKLKILGKKYKVIYVPEIEQVNDEGDMRCLGLI